MYNSLDIGSDGVAVKWIGDNCSTLFEVQGYTFDDLENANYSSPENVIRGDSDTAEIPCSQLTTAAGEPIYYRLVAVFDNGTVCSHSGTKNTFYRFDGLSILAIKSITLSQSNQTLLGQMEYSLSIFF